MSDPHVQTDEIASLERQPVAWLQTVTLEGSVEPVKVVFDGREGNKVFVRQADPRDPDPAWSIPLHEGDEPIVMVALSHISHHLSDEPDDGSGFLLSTRIVPVRREPGRVYVRTLRHDEVDEGDRVHVRPGDDVLFEAGSIVAELAAIDAAEAEEGEYTPLTPVLWTWFQMSRGHSDTKFRYLMAAARRLDTANMLLREVEDLRLGDGPAPAARRRILKLIGAVEMAVVALGRTIDMISRANKLLGVQLPVPSVLTGAVPSITAIRNAYEHIEDRALGQVNKKPDPASLTIFDHRTLIEENKITYGTHQLDLTSEVPALVKAARDYIKRVAGEADVMRA